MKSLRLSMFTLWAFALAANAATTENYYEILGLDRSTILCDSRLSACDAYQDGLNGYVAGTDLGENIYLVAEAGRLQAGGRIPYVMSNTRPDVYVRNVISYQQSVSFFYQYVGGGGGPMTAEWNVSRCREGAGFYNDASGSVFATASYGLTTNLPTVAANCLGETQTREITSGVSYPANAEYMVRFESLLGPETNSECFSCVEDTFLLSSVFGRALDTQGNEIAGVVTVHSPEPGTWIMLSIGLVALSFARRRVQRALSH